MWLEGSGTPTIDSNKVTVAGSLGEYTAVIDNLIPEQQYSFCAYAINSDGLLAYGETKYFVTFKDQFSSDAAIVAMNIINEGAGLDITIDSVEMLVDGSAFCSSVLGSPLRLPFGQVETIQMEVEPIELSQGTDLTIKVNGSAKQIRLSENISIRPGEVTTFDVPIKALERETVSDIFELQSAGSVMFDKGTAERHLAQINGEDVEAYVLKGDSKQTITIQGTARDLVEALNVGYYVASFEGRNAAMNMDNLNIWMPGKHPTKYILTN